MTKTEILKLLKPRRDKLRSIERVKILTEVIESIENNKITNYAHLKTMGIQLTLEPTHDRLTEGDKTTHYQGGKQWVTYKQYEY